MSTEKNQSAIAEVRDQLFLDTADGDHLGVVSKNIGLSRPRVGFSDDSWRAMVKKIAFNKKLIPRIFRDIIEVCIGPQFSIATDLSEDASVGDSIIKVRDSSDLVQLGTLVLDSGLSTEETVEYCYVDRTTNEVFLNTDLESAHSARDSASSILEDSVSSGATSITLRDSSEFATSGYPYPIIVGQGTLDEEIVTVSNNNPSTGVLTVSTLANNHEGFKAAYIKRDLDEATPAGRVFIKLGFNDTVEMPESGWVRLNTGSASEEIVEYEGNDIGLDILFLNTPLQNSHSSGDPVELLFEGVPVETASVLEEGIYWDTFNTDPKNFQIYIPDGIEANRLIDASYLHIAVPSTFSTTLASTASVGDSQFELTSVSGLPDEAGIVILGGTDYYYYIFKDEDATPNPTIKLTKDLSTGYSSGTTVELARFNYSGTDLEEGNIRDIGGGVQEHRYPGPYVFESEKRAISGTNTSLATLIPPPTRVAGDSTIGFTNIEVVDAGQYPTVTPYNVRIGTGTGFVEDLVVTDVSLHTTTGDIDSNATTGDTSLSLLSTASFPETTINNKAGYRIIIDEGTVDEEVVVVYDNDTSGNNLTIDALSTNHSTGTDNVRLLNDTLSFTQDMQEPHKADSVNPTKLGHSVDILWDSIDVVSSFSFPTDGGTIHINFGKERVDDRSRLVSKPSSTVYEFQDTSALPTTDYPYQVVLSAGRAEEEDVNVTNNNTSTNELTFSSAPNNTHTIGSWMEFYSGDHEVVEYASVGVDTLEFAPPKIFKHRHTMGESVILSTSEAAPNLDGFSYQFFLPPDRLVCLRLMFDLVRAAGVKITIINDR